MSASLVRLTFKYDDESNTVRHATGTPNTQLLVAVTVIQYNNAAVVAATADKLFKSVHIFMYDFV